MNNDENENFLNNLFSKTGYQFSSTNKNKLDPNKPDKNSIALAFAALTFMREAKKLMVDHFENNTELDEEKLLFLINQARGALKISLQDLGRFLPELGQQMEE